MTLRYCQDESHWPHLAPVPALGTDKENIKYTIESYQGPLTCFRVCAKWHLIYQVLALLPWLMLVTGVNQARS